MKVDIKVTTITKGMVFKENYFEVKVNFQLTEEEKAIIKTRGLQKKIVMEQDKRASLEDDVSHYITMQTLLDGLFATDFLYPTEVKYFQQELHDKLKTAKEYLKANEADPEDISFEI
ncbi:MAG: hypothetical protein DU489_07155 [Nitrosomonas sp.]|uniref:hypothetical protein n=1 Tax=Nitrosomonas sp. TaxID=42353 RepID=UPI0032EBC656